MKDVSLQDLVKRLREEVDLPGDQEEIDVAEPKGKITAADFKKLRSMKKEGQYKHSIDQLLKIVQTKKAGPEYKKALMDLINLAKEKTGKEIHSIADLKQALDYEEPKIREGADHNWPKEIPSRYADEFLFIHDDNKPGFYNVKDVQIGKIVDRYGFRTPESAIEFAQNKIKPQGGRQSSQFESSLYEGPDHEVAMAMSSLKEIVSNATQLMQKLGGIERNIPGWIQDHITNAENYIEQANQGFHEIE